MYRTLSTALLALTLAAPAYAGKIACETEGTVDSIVATVDGKPTTLRVQQQEVPTDTWNTLTIERQEGTEWVPLTSTLIHYNGTCSKLSADDHNGDGFTDLIVHMPGRMNYRYDERTGQRSMDDNFTVLCGNGRGDYSRKTCGK
jgi:hypothetical protein